MDHDYSLAIPIEKESTQANFFSLNTLGTEARIVQEGLGQYNVCWCPGLLCHQAISSHSINMYDKHSISSMRKDFNYLPRLSAEIFSYLKKKNQHKKC